MDNENVTTQLTEQEEIRRKNLQKIIDLGFNPFPAVSFDVDFKTTDLTTSQFQSNLVKVLAEIKNVDEVGAKKLAQAGFDNKFRTSEVLKLSGLMNELKISEIIEFDDSVGREAMAFEEFFSASRDMALGLYGPEKRGMVKIAGRFMGQRGPFAKLQDAHGIVQLYVHKKNIGNTDEDKSRYQSLVKLLDIGDHIGVEGELFSTSSGEVTIRVKELTLLAKSLRPFPVVKVDKEGNTFDAFTDPELRFRRRYVDLVVNPDVKNIFIKRSMIIRAIRRYFDAQGWLEVETPVLQPIHGGAAARPFATHHNSLDIPLYMRIANELYLKRLIVGGFDGVYEIGKMFRNEGMDSTHNPEFTSMEIYVAYKDYNWMMSMVEELLATISLEVNGSTLVSYDRKNIDFSGPYPRLSMAESILKYTDFDISDMDENALREVCKKLDVEVDQSMGKGKLIDEIFGAKVEKHLIQPTYITDYPIEMTPLAKKHRSKEGLVERFELFINGKEIANAYTELNDPLDQRQRFEDQLKLADRGDDEAMVLDQDFIRSLEYGMPPTSGLGIGIDRLTMMMTDQTSIQEVLFFPQMRPEKK